MKGKSISEYRNEITLTTFAIVLVFLDVYLSLLADAELLAKLLAFITVHWPFPMWQRAGSTVILSVPSSPGTMRQRP